MEAAARGAAVGVHDERRLWRSWAGPSWQKQHSSGVAIFRSTLA